MANQPTDKKGNKVRFIRKGGRVIPIKVKGPGDTGKGGGGKGGGFGGGKRKKKKFDAGAFDKETERRQKDYGQKASKASGISGKLGALGALAGAGGVFLSKSRGGKVASAVGGLIGLGLVSRGKGRRKKHESASRDDLLNRQLWKRKKLGREQEVTQGKTRKQFLGY